MTGQLAAAFFAGVVSVAAPSTTKTTVKPSTNGTLPASTRRGVGVPPATIER